MALSVFACVFFLGILSHSSHRDLGASWRNVRGGYQAPIHAGPGPPPALGPGESRPRPRDAEVTGGPSILAQGDTSNHIQDSQQKAHSKSHHIVNGLEVYPPPPPADEEDYVAMCLLVKDVALELREFFTHHYYHHGIRRFYLYDDGSNPPLSTHPGLDNYNVPEEVLNFTYIPPETVPADQRERLQDTTMERCVKEHGHKHHAPAI